MFSSLFLCDFSISILIPVSSHLPWSVFIITEQEEDTLLWYFLLELDAEVVKWVNLLKHVQTNTHFRSLSRLSFYESMITFIIPYCLKTYWHVPVCICVALWQEVLKILHK